MQANLLFDRLKPLKTLEENLSRNLSEIKLLISRARKQAASVSWAGGSSHGISENWGSCSQTVEESVGLVLRQLPYDAYRISITP